jgi:DNA-binding NtrC family response regulator/tetratricopeptide (TPR) repeat protein
MIQHPRYAPGEVLGEGAQGIVLRVTDREAPSRALVAKLWRPGAFNEGTLESEFALLSRRRVEGLVRAHDLAHDLRTGSPFLVEDFVAGDDLTAYVGKAASVELRVRRLTLVLCDVACALSSLHAAGFVHGDLKPAHLRIPRTPNTPADTHQGTVLLDLGAALSTHEGMGPVALTRAYAAPEVLAGSAPTPASDLYSLGASVWAVVTGAPPSARASERKPVRSLAPWVPPTLSDVIEKLVAIHPLDRYGSATDLLAALGQLAPGSFAASSRESSYATLFGRDAELAQLLSTGAVPGVRWVTGAPGSGKSHLFREAQTRALLAGIPCRLVDAGREDPALVMRLVRFLRGDASAWPFSTPNDGSGPRMLLLLDGVEHGPMELPSALLAHACRVPVAELLAVVAAQRTEKDDAIVLGPLAEPDFFALCRSLGVTQAERIAELGRASERSPGWVVAAQAGLPMDTDVVLERARTLPAFAVEHLAMLALLGGVMRKSTWFSATKKAGDALMVLTASGLVERRGDDHVALTSEALADALVRALSTPAISSRAAELLLTEDAPTVPSLLRVAAASPAPPLRTRLLSDAAELARARGLAFEETEALLALLSLPAERTAARLVRAERLTRDGGRKDAHQLVGEWLSELASTEPSVAPLSLRRSADKLARAGNYADALLAVERACEGALALGDVASLAYAMATRGAVHLYAGNGALAEHSLEEARQTLMQVTEIDEEEVARLDHNLGAALLYRNEPHGAALALARSLDKKRRLSDLGGVRSCLMNLGIAHSKARNWDAAELALSEATSLASTLKQAAGLGWCHVERAEMCLRRGRLEDAGRFAAEAFARRSALPAGVQWDLTLVRAEIALATSQPADALALLAELPPSARAEDAAVDARAWLVTARGLLATLPVRRRSAARAAARAMRRARHAGSDELFLAARTVLHSTRNDSQPIAPPVRLTMEEPRMDDLLWDLLPALTCARSEREAAQPLLVALARACHAERAFLVLGNAGENTRVWGMDMDGLPLDAPERRLEADVLARARASQEAVYERNVEGTAARGARLAFAKGNVILVLEHRFTPGCFDGLPPRLLHRAIALAGVVALLPEDTATLGVSSSALSQRLGVTEPSAPERASLSRRADHDDALHHDSTVNPRQGSRREFPEILGRSPALERALARLDAAIDSELPTLVTGETGVGKELFSRAIHDLGPRSRAPFVAVNCAAIPDSLFEAELFGHARGAFTGADRARPGLLARAEGGTLLLDEVGELLPQRQASLLRVLETRRYRSVGSDEERAFDVRIVAATNRDLNDLVSAGTFRSDLLFRLRVLDIRVPPLRERELDIPLLARHFLSAAGSRTELTIRALDALSSYSWPGNVRELAHQMQRIAALRVPVCDLMHLSRDVRAAAAPDPSRSKGLQHGQKKGAEAPPDEAQEVLRALEAEHGNITHAAARLGLTRHGLKKKMLRLGLRAKLSVQG